MKIHYFQRYHGKENVATANTMLLLNRLYFYSSKKFYQLLGSLLFDVDSCNLELSIQLQEKEKDSVPDAVIFQPSFKIIVETKRDNTFSSKQLSNHLKAFSDKNHQAEYNVLFTIASQKMGPQITKKVKRQLEMYNKRHKTHVLHVNTTFWELIDAIQEVIDDRDVEMQDVLDDYRDYCIQGKLFNPADWKLLRVRTAGRTLEFCKKANLYYDSAEYGYHPHAFLGLYDRKSVRAIGKIKAIFKAVMEKKELSITHVPTPIQGDDNSNCETYKKRILDAMRQSRKLGYDICNKEHFYFFVEQFFDTDFKKTSPYGLWKVKYFDLIKELELPENTTRDSLPTPDVIAERLKTKTWE